MRNIDDWTVMKYGWLGVFVLHVVFLLAGVHWLKSALNLWDTQLLEPGQIRLENFITAAYMLTIAFSIMLLIMAVFIFEIFRAQRKILRLLAEKQAEE
ncbi:MAG: hypothetical protein HY303_00635 [Candidatus Wallbacteria bacterium]|nr:hypothetical protein [Candidatus Wallbacteria bacterium]